MPQAMAPLRPDGMAGNSDDKTHPTDTGIDDPA
jgi:hypothetical protein